MPRSSFYGLLLLILSTLFSSHASAQDGGENTDYPAGVAARSSLPETRAWDYQFEGVSVEKVAGWLDWFGIAFPVKLGGEVSGWVWVQRGDKGWLRVGDYRLEGELNSPALSIDDWTIESSSLRFGYINGNWYVGNLSGLARRKNEIAGRLLARTRIPTKPTDLLQLSAAWKDVNLEPLASALGLELEIGNRAGSMELDVTAPLGSIGDLATWNGDASLDLNAIQVSGVKNVGLVGSIRLRDGQWDLRDSAISLGDQRLPLTGGGRLQATPDFRLQLAATQLDVAAAISQLSSEQSEILSGAVAGLAYLKGELSGDSIQGVAEAELTILADQLRLWGESLGPLNAQADYSNSNLQVKLNRLEIADGVATGIAAWQLLGTSNDGFPTQAAFDLSDIKLGSSGLLKQLLPRHMSKVGGIVNGQLRWQLHQDNALHPWSSDIRLRLTETTGFGASLRSLSLSASKDINESSARLQLSTGDQSLKGTGSISFLPVELENVELENVELENVEAENVEPADFLRLEGYRLQATLNHFQATFPLSESLTIPLDASGSIQANGTADSPLQTASGELSLLQTSIAEQLLKLSDLRFTVLPSEFRLEQFRLLNADQGQLVGSALIYRLPQPIAEGNPQPKEQLSHQLNLKIDDWKLDAYLKSLLASSVTSPSAGLRELINGLGASISLTAKFQKPADGTDWSGGWRGRMNGEVTNAFARNRSIGSLQFLAISQDSELDAKAQGNLFGGSLTAQVKGFSLKREDQLSFDTAELEFQNFQLDQLAGVAFGSRLGGSFRGRGSLTLESGGPNLQNSEWQISSQIPDFRSRGRSIARSLTLAATVSSNSLRIQHLRGGIAGGRIQSNGELAFNSDTSAEGMLTIDLQDIQLSHIAELFPAEYAPPLDGSTSFRGTLRIKRGANLEGNVRVRAASFFDLPIRNLHGMMRATWNRAFQFEKLTANDLSGNILGGRGLAELEIRGGSGSAVQLETTLKLSQARMDQLSKTLGFDHIVGTGRFDLQARLAAKQLRSLSDLYGSLHLDFRGGDARSLPVLGLLGQFAPVVQLASADIKGGMLDALIAKGQLQVKSLLLNSDAFWLIAEGTAGMLDGRLDMDVLLQTGGGLESQLASVAGQRLLFAAVPQLLLIMEVTDLLTDQSLFFHIGGTTAHPVVQPLIAQTLAKSLIRNVRGQLLAAPAPGTFPD